MDEQGTADYRGDNIAIRGNALTAGTLTFAVDSIQGVSVQRVSRSAPLVGMLALVALAFGGAMMSCGGLFVAAMHKEDPGTWMHNAWLIAGAGVVALFSARLLPPYWFVVTCQIGGSATAVYRATTMEQAQEIEEAIRNARGLG